MPTYKQVVNHVKKHVLWKDEYFERYYRLNPELVQKRLDKIYQAEDDLMVLISTQLFCFLQANGTLYFDGCYKTGKADNSLLCTNLALWSIELAILLSSDDELVRTGLITLCDKHLEWTDFHNSDKHCCLTGYEIQRQDLLLWPFEYQAVKNWRARQGLSTPMIEHPLMNSPMTTANCPDFSQWQRPEWFNPLVDFLAQRRPELAFLRHLFI